MDQITKPVFTAGAVQEVVPLHGAGCIAIALGVDDANKINERSHDMTNPLKGKGDMVKNVIIAVLVTGIIAFVGGMRYQSNVYKATEARVSDAVASVPKE